MKIRNGFVSNSSSSSFIVRWKEHDFDSVSVSKPTVLLTPEEVKKLKKFGFKPSTAYTAIQYEMASPEFKGKDEDKRLAYNISCNQTDVIYWLLKNNIGFEAACHHGDYTVVYRKDEKFFYTLYNIGLQSIASIRCGDDPNEIIREAKEHVDFYFRKDSVSEFITKEEKYMKGKEEDDENT